jgi:ornithine cyclodeaminase/alanine dehydrogenase-like protein (mu-crystallin family)
MATWCKVSQGFQAGGWVVRVLDRADVGRLVSMAEAITAVREAFAAADRGGAVMPAPPAARLAGEHGAGSDVPLGDWRP